RPAGLLTAAGRRRDQDAIIEEVGSEGNGVRGIRTQQRLRVLTRSEVKGRFAVTVQAPESPTLAPKILPSAMTTRTSVVSPHSGASASARSSRQSSAAQASGVKRQEGVNSVVRTAGIGGYINIATFKVEVWPCPAKHSRASRIAPDSNDAEGCVDLRCSRSPSTIKAGRPSTRASALPRRQPSTFARINQPDSKTRG